jgi:hypothetical protein
MERTPLDQAGANNHAAERGEAADPRVVETLRAALSVLAGQQGGAKEEKPEARKTRPEKPPTVSVFWELCTAALFSVASLVGLTLYTQMANDVNGLNSSVNMLRERTNDMVRKDDYTSRNLAVVATLKEVQASNKEALAHYKERLQAQERLLKEAQARFEQQVKDLEREVLRLRERLAALEPRDKPPEVATPKGKRNGGQ